MDTSYCLKETGGLTITEEEKKLANTLINAGTPVYAHGTCFVPVKGGQDRNESGYFVTIEAFRYACRLLENSKANAASAARESSRLQKKVSLLSFLCIGLFIACICLITLL